MLQETSKDVSTVQSPLAFSAQQLADRLGVSLRHIRRLDSSQKIPRPIRLGRSCRWTVAEIENWMAAEAPDRERWEMLKGGQK